MRRRITEAIVGVCAVVVVGLGIPLAIAVHQSILDSEVVELQADAARTLAEIDVPLDPIRLAEVGGEADAPPPFSVYDSDGRLLFGVGPLSGDAVVQRAITGDPASAVDGQIMVATPIIDDTSERVVGALRLTESLAGANHRSRVAWSLMAGAGVTALAIAWAIAGRLARRLSLPLSELAAVAGRMGDGHDVPRVAASGIDELDTLAGALTDASQRVNDALVRERRFSADVSHQLRTPLTGIRLRLEAVRGASASASAGTADLARVNAAGDLDAMLDDVNRLEKTIEHLLAFARGAVAPSAAVSLADAVRRCPERWNDRVASAGRNMVADASGSEMVNCSDRSIDQILDVLIDNALRHGAGAIRVVSRDVVGGGALDVSDEGRAIATEDDQRIFDRGHGDGTGIGLALARSIAEAEGGRLLLTSRTPTTFSLMFVSR